EVGACAKRKLRVRARHYAHRLFPEFAERAPHPNPLPVKCGAREKNYLPGRSSRLSSPAATLIPVWPWTLSGCSAIELFEPPTSTLPPTPTPIVALPCAPA